MSLKKNFTAFVENAENVCAACEHTDFDCAHCKVTETRKRLADEEKRKRIHKQKEEAMGLYDDLVRKYKEVLGLTEPIKPFNRETPWLLESWAETDLSYIICKAPDPVKRKEEILAFIRSYPCGEYFLTWVDMDKVMQDAMIRRDWETALRNHSYDELDSMVSYRFGSDDIKELATLHKKRRFRKKIEDLLENCNFHSECCDFANGRYDKYLNGGDNE